MATVVGKLELCRIDDFEKYFKAIQGIEGHTLFSRFHSLANIVRSNIEVRYQDFLAYPVLDQHGITFYGRKYTETPRLFSELQDEDLEKYNAIKDSTIAHYQDKISSLRNSGNKTEADYLTGAIKFIDNRFLYCYDESVVLGVWGMQLRDTIREDINQIRKSLFTKRKSHPDGSDGIPQPEPTTLEYVVSFNAGENGTLSGESHISKEEHSFLTEDEIPKVEPKEGFHFAGWDENPTDYKVSGDKVFTAQYEGHGTLPPPSVKLPWYRRFWNWLRALFLDPGCLKWLLWILLFLFLFWLFSALIRGCNEKHHIGGSALNERDSAWIRQDPNVGNVGGIYDPHNPYQLQPTPPGFDNLLPPHQGVLPPITENPDTIPGNPTIIGDRLNVLMENEDKSILDFVKSFKSKYPGEKYKIVYYDDVVKRIQIEVPGSERERLKTEIPGAFKPEYELFVFDEALFEGTQVSKDPYLSDSDKSWYLSAIHAQQAWSITRGSDKITVAIVDNGFSLDHPELASKVVGPYNVWKHSPEVFPQEVDHGTHVAGIALAIADNGLGISGIAPNCKFMPVQVADARGLMTTTSVLDGILYSLYQGADVINVSLGGQFSGLSQYNGDIQDNLISNHFKEEERLWRRVMRIAASHNSTLVIAAGNDNVLAGIDPLQRPELFITVSATDRSNRMVVKTKFSNYGPYSTISAPGAGIFSTVGKNGYATMEGTSMAAPVVAGAVALMKSLNNAITTKQIICILQTTGLQTQGNIGRLIQLDKALQKVRTGEVVDCTPVPSSGDVQILLSWDNYNDLDLICTDPYGETVFFRNRRVSSGGQLEIDMNVEYPDSKKPIENIFWKPGAAPEGTYNIYLLYYKIHEPDRNKTPYRIKIKYNGMTDEYEGEVLEEKKLIHICSFTVCRSGEAIARQLIDSTGQRQLELEQQRSILQQQLDRVNNELKRIGNNR